MPFKLVHHCKNYNLILWKETTESCIAIYCLCVTVKINKCDFGLQISFVSNAASTGSCQASHSADNWKVYLHSTTKGPPERDNRIVFEWFWWEKYTFWMSETSKQCSFTCSCDFPYHRQNVKIFVRVVKKSEVCDHDSTFFSSNEVNNVGKLVNAKKDCALHTNHPHYLCWRQWKQDNSVKTKHEVKKGIGLSFLGSWFGVMVPNQYLFSYTLC